MDPAALLPNYVAEKIAVEPTGCWRWTGAISCGYGHVQDALARRVVGAHCFVYSRLVGPVPTGHHLHHRCGVRACVNPMHLTPMPAADHFRHHLTREICKRGHSMADAIVRKTGKRQCRACVQAADRARYWRTR